MTSSINTSMGAREWIMLIALSVLWGGSVFFVGVVVADLPPLTIVVLRVGLAATLSYAFAGVYGRRFKTMGLNPIVTAAGQVTASTLILTPITLYIDGPLNLLEPSMGTWAAIVRLAVLSTAVAYILYFKILESAGATNLLLVTLLLPVSAILLGSLFLNEALKPVHFVGMALIALGLSAIDGRLWKWKVLATA